MRRENCWASVMKKRQKLLTDEQWELVGAVVSRAAAQERQSGPSLCVEPGMFGRHPLGSANRGGMAVLAR